MFCVVVVSSDSFNRLSHLLSFVNNFFIFLFRSVWFFQISFKRQLVYFITSSSHLSTTFFKLFFCLSTLQNHFAPSIIPPRLSGMLCFASAVSATKIILPLLFWIVNVFLVFYLFRTIQTISFFYSYCIQNNPFQFL